MKKIGEIMKSQKLKAVSNSTDAPPGVGTSYLARLIELIVKPRVRNT
jgi:hypothetical protein